MPWKLILFLICLVLTTFFIGFNLENSCNIHIGFKTYENVPVFLTVLVSFALGAIVAFLFSLGLKFSKKQKTQSLQKPLKKNSANSVEKNQSVHDTKQDAVVTKPKKNLSMSKIFDITKPKKSVKEEKALDNKTIVLDDSKGK